MSHCLLVNASISDVHSLPLGVLWLAANLRRDGHNITTTDYQISGLQDKPRPSVLAKYCLDFAMPVIGFSVTCASLPTVLGAVSLIKEWSPETVIILGGPGVCDRPQAIMTNFPADFLVVGEGEITSSQLLHALTTDTDPKSIPGLWLRAGDRVVTTGNPHRITDLDRLALPDYGEIDFSGYSNTAAVVVTRGCPYQCSFCSAHSVWGHKVISRSSESVATEIRSISDQVDVVEFHDDTFLGDPRLGPDFILKLRQWGFDLPWACNCRADRLSTNLGRQLSALGCQQVLIGAESGNDRVLSTIHKQITTADCRSAINIAAGTIGRVTSSYIWGYPDETEQELIDTLMCIAEDHRLPGVAPQIALLSPLAGSPLGQAADNLQFDPTLNPGGMLPATMNITDYPDLIHLITTYPDIFSAHHYIAHESFQAKRQLINNFCQLPGGNCQ